jgi:hypothetical protein
MHSGRPGPEELRRAPDGRIDGFLMREDPVDSCVTDPLVDIEIGGGFTGSSDAGEISAERRNWFTAALRHGFGPEWPRWVMPPLVVATGQPASRW